MKIAVLITCFNRKAKTLNSLRSLYSITSEAEVYLVDDGSTDGTSQAVSSEFERVHIIQGSGDLYWSRGMFTAWSEAIKGEYDYYLWLNDDVKLYPHAFEELFYCCRFAGGECVVSGLVEELSRIDDLDKVNDLGRADDLYKTTIIYGGYDEKKRLIQPSDKPQDIVFMNGNIVLIPNSVVTKIGIIDPVYHHDLGDLDYGLTARRNGIKVISTRRAVAGGHENRYCRVRCWDTDLISRFRRLYSPLGSNPRINFYYRNKNFGVVNASIYYLFIHILNLLPDSIVEALWQDTYKKG